MTQISAVRERLLSAAVPEIAGQLERVEFRRLVFARRRLRADKEGDRYGAARSWPIEKEPQQGRLVRAGQLLTRAIKATRSRASCRAAKVARRKLSREQLALSDRSGELALRLP